MTGVKIVNGVDVGASPSLPRDGLCPTCREPFSGVETSAVVATQSLREGAPVDRVDPPRSEGPYFTPCRHDARGCFPSVTYPERFRSLGARP